MARSKVTVRSSEQVVCEQCLVADRPLARMRGLLGRKTLPRGEAILLRPAASIHTFFMQFPIDVVFLDSDRRVVRIAERVPPWRTVAKRSATAVLELAAGECALRGLREGDQLELTPLQAGT